MDKASLKKIMMLVDTIIKCFIYTITMNCILKVTKIGAIVYSIFCIAAILRDIFLIVKLYLAKNNEYTV